MKGYRNGYRAVYFFLSLICFTTGIVFSLQGENTFYLACARSLFFALFLCGLVRVINPRGTQFLALYVFSVVSFGTCFRYLRFFAFPMAENIRNLFFIGDRFFLVWNIAGYALGAALFFVCENLVLTYISKKNEENRK